MLSVGWPVLPVLLLLVVIGEMLVREVGGIGSVGAFELFDIREPVTDSPGPDPGGFETVLFASLDRAIAAEPSLLEPLAVQEHCRGRRRLVGRRSWPPFGGCKLLLWALCGSFQLLVGDWCRSFLQHGEEKMPQCLDAVNCNRRLFALILLDLFGPFWTSVDPTDRGKKVFDLVQARVIC